MIRNLVWAKNKEYVWVLHCAFEWHEISAERTLDGIKSNLKNKFPDAEVSISVGYPTYEELHAYMCKDLTIKFTNDADEAFFITLMSPRFIS